ncbi:hypothetical protein CHS0354_027950 [Potamilus streckersoni]|uniref:Uncharacterized protein n=1 Tax=Potamilus streckersoni TaxID=2493646 RepID=A0AAE0T4D9_9BIVA|nr:hypothetical protein CHS0354_027950 [Potamilus streckersoni]
MDESLDKEFVQRARIATAIACIATRPDHLTTREHVEQLCRKYQESQLCLKEKYEDAQLEILQLEQKLIMTHNGGISSLTKMDMKVADSSGPVNCVSSALNPTHCFNQATDFMASPILWEHVKFLHCICSLKTAELLTSTHETDKVTMETLRHTVTCVKNCILSDSSLPCLKYISECADCWKHAIPMMDLNFQKEMVSRIRELCNQIITVQLSTDASKNHEKRKQYKDFIVKLAYCDILRETIHDILLCKLEDFARYLRKVSGKEILLDPLYFQNIYYIFKALEQSFLGDQKFSHCDILHRLDDCLLHITKPFPLFAHAVWHLQSILYTYHGIR